MMKLPATKHLEVTYNLDALPEILLRTRVFLLIFKMTFVDAEITNFFWYRCYRLKEITRSNRSKGRGGRREIQSWSPSYLIYNRLKIRPREKMYSQPGE